MDQQDCIILIKDLPPKLRTKCIKIYIMIATNIIENPNERKYKFLHHDKIWRKFNKTQVFIDLMLHSGFKKLNKPKSILIFNTKYLHLLKQSIQSLENIDSLSENESNQDISIDDKRKRRRTGIRSNNHDDHDVKYDEDCKESKEMEQIDHLHHIKDINDCLNLYCICGSILIESTPIKIYGITEDTSKSNVLCDECLKQCHLTDTIYHCPKGTDSNQHKYGYDICNECIIKIENRNKKRCRVKNRHSYTVCIYLQ